MYCLFHLFMMVIAKVIEIELHQMHAYAGAWIEGEIVAYGCLIFISDTSTVSSIRVTTGKDNYKGAQYLAVMEAVSLSKKYTSASGVVIHCLETDDIHRFERGFLLNKNEDEFYDAQVEFMTAVAPIGTSRSEFIANIRKYLPSFFRYEPIEEMECLNGILRSAIAMQLDQLPH